MTFNKIFKDKVIIGMVHLLPLPGSANFKGNVDEIEERALEDAKKLIDGGITSLIVENFEDTPYQETIGIEAYSIMLKIVCKIKELSPVPVGVNIQFNDINKEWALAYATKCDFLRAETFVETRIGVHGISYPSAPVLMKLKHDYPSNCMIFADVNVKHTKALVEISLKDAAMMAIEAGADAIIITGKETGCNPKIEDVIELREAINDFPILLGSGINEDNIAKYLEYADGAIIGSSIKMNKNVHLGIDEKAVQKIMKTVKEI